MAATPELVDYIKKSIDAGRTLYEIKYDLMNEGWNEADIETAIRDIQAPQQPAPQTQYAMQPQQPVQQPQQPQYAQQPQQPQQPTQPPQETQPTKEPRSPLIGAVFSIVVALILFLDVILVNSRTWIDIFSSFSVVDTSELGIGLIVLLLVFATGICLGGVISVKKKAVPAGLLVIVLSFISMLTFAGLLTGILGIMAGVILFLKK